jgi:formate/nitrite transporter FocA (FNT family)
MRERVAPVIPEAVDDGSSEQRDDRSEPGRARVAQTDGWSPGQGGDHLGGTDADGRPEHLRDDQVEQSLDRVVEQGRPRLHRTWTELLATGTVGGMEVAFGVVALLAVEEATGSELLAGLAFSVGFIALLLGHAELFTEGFLVPVTVVAAKQASWWQLGRFWVGTLAGNLVGGWLFSWLIMLAFPALHEPAIRLGGHYATAGLSARTFALAVLAGAAITLLTRMRTGTDDDVAKIVASVTVAFLIAGLGMFHSVLDSLLIFSGIQAGGGFGYGQWAVWFGWTLLGNLLGGVGLTTLLRLIRSRNRLQEWRSVSEST